MNSKDHEAEGLEVQYLSGVFTNQKLSLEEKLAELQSYPTNTVGGLEVKEELCRNVEFQLKTLK